MLAGNVSNERAGFGTAEFIHVVQRRQRHLIASPEEIAFAAGWISAADLQRQAERLGKTEYGKGLGF